MGFFSSYVLISFHRESNYPVLQGRSITITTARTSRKQAQKRTNASSAT